MLSESFAYRPFIKSPSETIIRAHSTLVSSEESIAKTTSYQFESQHRNNEESRSRLNKQKIKDRFEVQKQPI